VVAVWNLSRLGSISRAQVVKGDGEEETRACLRILPEGQGKGVQGLDKHHSSLAC
jgi:hypothetical protein